MSHKATDQRAAIRAKLVAAHSQRFVWSMTGVVFLFFAGLALAAFFVLRSGQAPTTPNSHNQQKSGGTEQISQQPALGLSVQTESQATQNPGQMGTAQTALQGSVPAGGADTNPNVSSPIQNAGTATPQQVNDNDLNGGTTNSVPPTSGTLNRCGAPTAPAPGSPRLLYPDYCVLSGGL
ncbi:MAG TPA: hypothetical protein VJP80_03330 [Candidatus Saccharimonadales bacterium]|nr:hypothetical protein [Candidatus Saccharimonadales bacterium]